jgi:ketosteroid isomerase-like protein
MRKLWIVAVLAIVAVALGCGAGGGAAESVAKKILEAGKAGDFDTIAKYMDWKGIYDQIPEEARGGKSFEDCKKEAIEAAKKEVKPEKDFEYQILEVKEEGDTATVKTKTRKNKDAEWREDTVTFKKIDGTWKTTLGMGM